MKLLIDTASQRILFAEAGKDVVDFLFGVLATPVGAVASLLLAEGADALMVGNVYASAEKMDAAFMQGADARDALVVNTTGSFPTAIATAVPEGTVTCPCTLPSPRTSIRWATRTLRPVTRPASRCHRRRPPTPPAPACRGRRCTGATPATHWARSRGARGSSRAWRRTRYTSISSLELLKKLGVKDLDAIVQRTVSIGRKECLEILKMSFRSKAVLTDVFLAARKRARTEEDKN
ncbi:hypothetical protein EJB05_31533, partial [Eragrostis curvula]